MPTKTEKTGSFIAKDESGKEYRINIFTTYLKSHERDEWDPLNINLKLDNGIAVNKVSDDPGEYETVDVPPMKLHSDDPKAI